jgi:uncharacterized UBP type Zn finger protein
MPVSEFPCEHLEVAASREEGVHPSGHGCQECLAAGTRWVHLRLCLECGHVGCCDDSPRRHATAHFHATRHPVIRSYEPGEDWLFCYRDGTFVDGVRPLGDEAAPVHYQSP